MESVPMILNDTLQKHRDCLEQCKIERDACEREDHDKDGCETESRTCELYCDFDYGP